MEPQIPGAPVAPSAAGVAAVAAGEGRLLETGLRSLHPPRFVIGALVAGFIAGMLGLLALEGLAHRFTGGPPPADLPAIAAAELPPIAPDSAAAAEGAVSVLPSRSAPPPAPSPALAQPVMLEFSATWCGPCGVVRPAVEALMKAGYPIRVVDVDRQPDVAARYSVRAVPCFVVIDAQGRELNRLPGVHSAARLASFYAAARQTVAVPIPPTPTPSPQTPPRTTATTPVPAPVPTAEAVAPRPWTTAVRIRIASGQSIGYGSGTIVRSDPDSSVILTCAHLFSEGPADPRQFRLPIAVDLFDDVLVVRSGVSGVAYRGETHAGEAIDYDRRTDVGLIRIRPGRVIPASPVAPAWTPSAGETLCAVGCPEGRDATAWNTRFTRGPIADAGTGWSGVECQTAPKQGRSGGGLFNSAGELVGVCDFADASGNRGLYAALASIHAILQRNRLGGTSAAPTIALSAAA